MNKVARWCLIALTLVFLRPSPGSAQILTNDVASGNNPNAIAVNPATNQYYVANGDGTVTIIDGVLEDASTVTAGANPCGVAVNPVTNQIYVTN